MTGLSALWLPILVSAVLVFVASSLIHMASPWHKSDYPKCRTKTRSWTRCVRWRFRRATISFRVPQPRRHAVSGLRRESEARSGRPDDGDARRNVDGPEPGPCGFSTPS